jgi:predicted PurR-regulated permease PerM
VLVVSVAGLALLLTGWLLAAQAVQLTAELPAYQENVARRIEALRRTDDQSALGRMQRFLERITAAATRPAVPTDSAIEVKVVGRAEPWDALTWVSGLQPLTEPIASAGLVIVLLIYLLIYREDARSRMLCLFGVGHLTTTTKALDDAGRRISKYLLAQFLLNVGYGVVIAVGLALLRVPHAMVWGFFAALLRYIPVVGPWIAACLPVGLSLLISDNLLWPASVIALFAVCELVSNLIVEPIVFGQSMAFRK